MGKGTTFQRAAKSPGLLDLPNEILSLIHIYSQSAALPLTCRRLWALTSPTLHRAYFLRQAHPRLHISLRRAIRRRMCTPTILTRLDRLEHAAKLGKPYLGPRTHSLPPPLSLKGLRVPRHYLERPDTPEKEESMLRSLKELLDRGVDPRNPEDLPLTRAIRCNWYDLAALLLRYGASALKADLRPAIAQGHIPILRLLMDAGAPIDGECMDIAVKKKQWAVIRIFVQAGVVPTLQTLEGI